ncbi:MAG: carbohydrate kinase family protein [Chloroflexota bacterium]|nr:carbohydrate kinase family protein [Chloroflexota bacterium]
MRVAVIGDCTLDVTVRPGAPPHPGGDVPASVELGPGGQGANVAVRLARLGVSVSLAAPVADDVTGRILRSSLAAEDVQLHALDAARSATVVALLDTDGERAMLSDRVTIDPAAASRASVGADWVHCSAYALADDATGDALASRLGDLAVAAPVSVGGGSLPPDPALAARVRARLAASGAALLVFSRDEAASLLGTRVESLAAGAAALHAAFPGTWAIVTGGADGSAAAGPVEALSVPGRRVETVDATGAGDAYAAGLIAALLHEPWPPAADAVRRAMLAATELGAQTAGVLGAQGLP